MISCEMKLYSHFAERSIASRSPVLRTCGASGPRNRCSARVRISRRKIWLVGFLVQDRIKFEITITPSERRPQAEASDNKQDDTSQSKITLGMWRFIRSCSTPTVCPGAFPIKASDNTSRTSSFVSHNAVSRDLSFVTTRPIRCS